MGKFVNFKKVARGQGMTEYIIIVALIAIAAIGVYSAFGNVVKGQTAEMAMQLGGNNGTAGTSAATSAASTASSDAGTTKNLSNYATGNQ
jgi:Flp pilus assembly pilin Flp